MKQLSIGIALILFATISFSQSGYQKGVIVMQNNDTLFCLVPIATSFGSEVSILRTENDKIEYIPLKNIKYLANGFNVYENVAYINKKGKEMHKLMWIQVDDEMTLYLETELIQGPIQTSKSGGTTSTLTPRNTYVIRKDNRTYPIEEVSFIENIRPLLADAPSLLNKVENGLLSYEKIETVVKAYNYLTRKDTSGATPYIHENVDTIVNALMSVYLGDSIYSKVESEASFPGGKKGWTKYISTVIEKKKEELQKAGVLGSCTIKFVVDLMGNVSNVEAVTMKGTKLAEIAEKAIFYGPKWHPARHKGKVVNSYQYQEVSFK